MDDPFPGNQIITIILTSTELYLLISSTIVLLFLFLGSALISGSEIAFFSLTQDQLKVDQKSKGRISKLLKNPKQLLATVLVLNNFINIAIIMISSYVAVNIFGQYYSNSTILGALTIIMTIMIVLIGEIVPKVYANQNNYSFAKKTSWLISFFSKLLYPFSKTLINVSSIIEKRFVAKGYNLSIDELNHALEITVDNDATNDQKELLKGIVNFGTLSVKQIMKSRMDITMVDYDMTFNDLLKQINECGYSRIPVYRETIDEIKGILYVKDLLPYVNESKNFQWNTLLRPSFFVPDTKKIDSLFKDFQEKRIHIAIVVDEYGGTSGLITMEDVIEEIVGEITDEFDQETNGDFVQLDQDTYIFEGKTSLMDFCRIVQVDRQIFSEIKGESESIGGLLLEINSKIPEIGEEQTYKNLTFTPVLVNEKRIVKVRVAINREQ